MDRTPLADLKITRRCFWRKASTAAGSLVTIDSGVAKPALRISCPCQGLDALDMPGPMRLATRSGATSSQAFSPSTR